MLCLMQTRIAFLAARALLTHIQLAINQDPQVPFCGTAFQHIIPQSGLPAFEGVNSSSKFCVICKHARYPSSPASKSFGKMLRSTDEDLQNPTSASFVKKHINKLDEVQQRDMKVMKAGALVLQGVSGGAGLVQPRAETASGGPDKSKSNLHISLNKIKTDNFLIKLEGHYDICDG
ncbi:hypothetical protein BTVI_42773 [Pitangus sulphuratus]|nr:hypothetical protein BTVI_42773 [Pitangus sulphuratus]